MSVYIETEDNEDDDDKNRTYIVTATFKISGFLPDKVTEEHIKGNIISDIREAVGDIALSSEYYGDDEDEEWEMFLEGDIELEMEEMAVKVCARPFCEHCGENHTDFGAEISDGGTSWCLDCYLSGRNRTNLSKEDIEEIRKSVKKLKRKYLLKQLHELEGEEEE
jgi:hypothetical protein